MQTDVVEEKVKILSPLNYYLPGYRAGGPIRSLSNLVSATCDRYKFFVVTSDRDSRMEQPYEDVLLGEWTEVNGASVFYSRTDRYGLSYWVTLIRKSDFDVIYLNSFFNYRFTILPLLAVRFFKKKPVKIVLAPRGELYDGALNYRAVKKKIYIIAFRLLLSRGVRVQATDDNEVCTILKHLGKSIEVCVSKNIPGKPSGLAYKEFKGNNPVKLLCVSRVDSKKNIDGVLEALMEVEFPVEFKIIGPISDEKYWDKCKSLINSLPANVECKYLGPVSHNDLKLHYEQSDYFVLLTHGENFGHVIYEALSYGLPVILSGKTIWTDNVTKSNAGWIINEDDKDRLGNVLGECSQMSASTYQIRSRAAINVALEYYKDSISEPYGNNLFVV